MALVIVAAWLLAGYAAARLVAWYFRTVWDSNQYRLAVFAWALGPFGLAVVLLFLVTSGDIKAPRFLDRLLKRILG